MKKIVINKNNEHCFRIISALIAFCMFFSLICDLPIVVSGATTEWTTYASGICGKNKTSKATWKLLTGKNSQIINNVVDNKRLIISGEGETENYIGSTNAPWQEIAWDATSIIVDEGITHIGDNSFQCASYFTCYVSLPESLQSIGSYAFCGTMKYVKELKIPKNVKYIGEYAFYNGSFTNLEIPGNVTALQKGVFGYCKSLKSVTIPKSVTSIDDYAFDNCTSLTDIYYDGTISDWKDITIGTGNSYLLNATVHFPVVNVESISLDKATETMLVGGKTVLTATVLPQNADTKTLLWESSNTKIATVSNGIVTALTPGTTIITVTTANGTKAASCIVTVAETTHIIGDVDNDGKITTVDLVILARHLAGWKGYEVLPLIQT